MTVHGASSNAARVAYLGSWLIFASVILLMEGWSDAGALYLFLGALAFVGTVTAALWAFRDSKWVFGALISSLALLSAYAFWWTVDISSRYSVDPEPGLLHAMAVQLEIWVSMARHLVARSHYLYAFCQLYWGAVMPLIQMAFLPSMLRSLKSARTSPAGAVVA